MGYFKKSEFECPCGCGMGYDDMSLDLLEKIDNARRIAGVSFILNSAVRCPIHNKGVGGSPTSSHLTGDAVDIACPFSGQRFRIIQGLLKAGFTRIGIAEDFIHADIDKNKPQEVLWVYK